MNLMERMVEQAEQTNSVLFYPKERKNVLYKQPTEYWPTTSPILYSSGNRLKLWNLPIGTS